MKPTSRVTMGKFTFEVDKKYEYLIDEDTAVRFITDKAHKYIHYHTDIHLPSDFDWILTGKDKYGLQGSPTKRVTAFFWKHYGYVIEDVYLAQLGNILSDIKNINKKFYFDIVTNLERPSEYFKNIGSCWWTSSTGSRYLLMDLGGGAIRVFDKDLTLIGRCWFTPSYGYNNHNEFVYIGFTLFNEYGLRIQFFGNLIKEYSDLNVFNKPFSDINKVFYLNNSNNCIVLSNYQDIQEIVSVSTYPIEEPKLYRERFYCVLCGERFPILNLVSRTGPHHGVCINCYEAQNKKQKEKQEAEREGIEEDIEEIHFDIEGIFGENPFIREEG